jgi:hypothetical protein
MAHFLNLFSPETYQAFSKSDRSVSGFRLSQRAAAERIAKGDRFLCYMTKLSRWVGILDIISGPYEDDSPIFYEQDDPFVLRFKVRPIVWLDRDHTIPIHDNRLWEALSFTRGQDKKKSRWPGPLRSSLKQLGEKDASLIEAAILTQGREPEPFPIDDGQWKNLIAHRVRTASKTVSVTVPEDSEVEETLTPEAVKVEARESIQVQAL